MASTKPTAAAKPAKAAAKPAKSTKPAASETAAKGDAVDPAARIAALAELLGRYKDAYYNGTPLVSDAAYDQLEDELRALWRRGRSACAGCRPQDVAPGLVATSVFAFIQAWNEYVLAYVLLSSQSKQTLTVWLAVALATLAPFASAKALSLALSAAVRVTVPEKPLLPLTTTVQPALSPC